jgi:hypothetical protein
MIKMPSKLLNLTLVSLLMLSTGVAYAVESPSSLEKEAATNINNPKTQPQTKEEVPSKAAAPSKEIKDPKEEPTVAEKAQKALEELHTEPYFIPAM